MATTTAGSTLQAPSATETTTVTFFPADERDMTSTTRMECWLASTGILMSSVGFFCVCLGLSYRFLVVTLVGYVMAPVGVVVFVAFLFLYQTSRRLKCQAAVEDTAPWKYDRVNSDQLDPRDMPLVAVRTTNGFRTVVATEPTVPCAPDVVAGSVNRLRDSHV
ncbi:uncharacterized protein LOC142589708 [Dermacentor variabilis]|uniref:uncharacterized protein LOC142589708 n=1 Tax=Dermacentor variabilis TaxID=34621 RepID=UPI003F5BB95D